MLLSPWKITWDPAGAALVILDYGQEISGPIRMPWSQEHEDRRVIEGDATEPLPRAHVSGSLQITVRTEHANNAAALDYVRAHRATIHALRGLRKTLRITPEGGTDDDKPNTMIKSMELGVVADEEDRSLTEATYVFLGPW